MACQAVARRAKAGSPVFETKERAEVFASARVVCLLASLNRNYFLTLRAWAFSRR